MRQLKRKKIMHIIKDTNSNRRMSLRLKLQLKFCDEQNENALLINEKKQWFYLNKNQVKSIAELQSEMRKRFNISDQMRIQFLIDDFEIPSFESTCVFREDDRVSYVFFFHFFLIFIPS